jgi:Uma2 family endonuclease
MNIVFTHSADELPPCRPFSADDVRRMVEAHVLAESENVELIDGELVMMAAKGYAHEVIRQPLLTLFVKAAPDHVMVAAGTTLQLSDAVLVEADIVIFPRASLVKSDAGFMHVAQGGALLAIEIAASSMRYDKALKAGLYARFGVREYWVIDANERITWVHTGPAENGWSSILEHGAGDALTTSALPRLSVRLADIG